MSPDQAKPPICLTIAGSDSSGGAGIQADLKTFTALNCYGMSVITAITAQNTQGVKAIQSVDLDVITQQIDCVFEDIRPDSVKIGMLGDSEIIKTVAQRLNYWQASNIVLDPVMVATSGATLLKSDAISSLIDELIPISTVLTPNLQELLVLANALQIKDANLPNSENQLEDLSNAVFDKLYQANPDVMTALFSKGGHLDKQDSSGQDNASDLLLYNQAGHADRIEAGSDDSKSSDKQLKHLQWYKSPRVDTLNTHGTGCTLSSAMCAFLAKGQALDDACQSAKGYLQKCLEAGLDLGKSNGPLWHQAK